MDFLHRAAYLYPDKTAVVDGERRYSYRQLAERSWRLANTPLAPWPTCWPPFPGGSTARRSSAAPTVRSAIWLRWSPAPSRSQLASTRG